MLGAIKGTSPLCRSVQDREDLRSLEHVVLGHFAHRGCRCRLFSRRLHYEHADLGEFHYESRSPFASIMIMVELDGEITQGSSCSFSCIHCFACISRDVAFRLRGRRHEFFVARLLSLVDVSSLHLNRLESSDVSFSIVCIRKELPPSPRTC